MQTDEQEVETIEVEDTFHVHDEKTASWVVRKITEERAHRDRVAAWAQAETRRSDGREQFLLLRFGTQLSEWTRQSLARRHGKRRSIHLPSGIIGFRVEPAKVIVTDEQRLIAWCKAHLPSAVKVVESVLKGEVLAHIEATGERPRGAELGGGGEKFYIK